MPCLTLCGQENSKIQQVAEICLNVLANAMKMGAQWSQNEGTSYGTASEWKPEQTAMALMWKMVIDISFIFRP